VHRSRLSVRRDTGQTEDEAIDPVGPPRGPDAARSCELNVRWLNRLSSQADSALSDIPVTWEGRDMTAEHEQLFIGIAVEDAALVSMDPVRAESPRN
jgi:hypothetical protein